MADESVRLVPLSNSDLTCIVDSDVELPDCKWRVNPHGYVERSRTYSMRQGSSGYSLLHRLVMNAAAGTILDHINGDKLDNRRANLRVCSRSENRMNSDKQNRKTSTKYKGVHWDKSRNLWLAIIGVDGRSKNLGRYLSQIDAARAYDRAATEHFGQFAKLNFPKA